MNSLRSYNHIKHLVNNNDTIKKISRHRLHWQVGYDEASQLDGKQRHTRFDHYECDFPKLGRVDDFQEHLDLEYDRARHQDIHGHGCGETCYT